MKAPAVSVLLPTNRWDGLLQRAVRSILQQTFSDFELLLVDDAEGKKEQAGHSLAASDSRIRLIPSHGTGLVDALNTGIGLARGAWLARMDADDIAHRQRLCLQVRYLREHPSVDVLGTGALAVTEDVRPLYPIRVASGHRAILDCLSVGRTALIHPTTFIRTALLRGIGGYTSELLGAEDLDLWLRLAPEVEFANLPRQFLLYTVRRGQASESSCLELGTVRRRLAVVMQTQPHHSVPRCDEARVLEETRFGSVGAADRAAIDLQLYRITGRGPYLERAKDELATLSAKEGWWAALTSFCRARPGPSRQACTRGTYVRYRGLVLGRYFLWVLHIRLIRFRWNYFDRRKWLSHGVRPDNRNLAVL
jgi:hypothetical protein